ncbi:MULTISPECIES: multidrug efflux SMR transporter [unclassified Gemella]|uniref:DMT family transporter n=1 Tax=unclassified Gemella TaxID=2624949 RepID=UPI0010733FE3|nr:MULTISPECIES: multidrug efflux SMR transporter [unclassified Gemella]MBF0710310.1 multidrug efflux SMR transporter [Gemella sp. GL1.1]MBF0746986.1 multidrug efflux SMR transporter [Gemella sp. 19428wG2_WT2a]NYS27654.1 multidrug efflux SMR transporter [Gemella sp. GL1]TFU58804.1 multidrug efflux SMR transporter [Gemella sp. WT2a]
MYYLFLFLAIVTEVLGSSLLKLSEGFTKIVPTSASLISFGFSFYFLSLALARLPLGIAYATWTGLGLILTNIIAILIYKENINLYTILGLILIIAGVLIINILGNASH